MKAEKARSYFFSAVSHDIRTPLNAIIGFSEILQTGDVPPEEKQQSLDMIVSSGKMLLQLVNDVLDLSKMDLGKLEFSLKPMDVGELLREPMPVFQPLMADKSQTFALEIAEMSLLMVDTLRFRQVLFNFVSNAVKYAGPCTIRISSAYEDGLFKLTVADNGKGVTPEKAKRLMQPFVQSDIQNRASGLAAAKARGVKFGWPESVPPPGFAEAIRRVRNGEISAREGARLCGMPCSTFHGRMAQLPNFAGNRQGR